MAKLLIIISISMVMGALSSVAIASENGIARWTDENGQVHFGNPQFAPAGEAINVSVEAANGMVVPQASPGAKTSARVAYIKKAPKKNKRGWRGYEKRSKRGRY